MYTFQLAHLKLKNLLRFTFSGCHSQDANSADCKQIKPVVYNTLESTFSSYIRWRHHSCLTHHSSVWALDSEVLSNKKSLLWMLLRHSCQILCKALKNFGAWKPWPQNFLTPLSKNFTAVPFPSWKSGQTFNVCGHHFLSHRLWLKFSRLVFVCKTPWRKLC